MPSAALALRGFIDLCDFLSIGTNDLVQYLLAADRTNGRSASCTALYPAVLQLLRDVVRLAARRQSQWRCAARSAATRCSRRCCCQLGLTELSLHPGTLLEVRRAIRGCDAAALRGRPALLRARDRAGIERWLAAHAPRGDTAGGGAR